MYITILWNDVECGVFTYELPSYAARFENEDFESYIEQTLGFGINSCDWMVHTELPQFVELHNQEYA